MSREQLHSGERARRGSGSGGSGSVGSFPAQSLPAKAFSVKEPTEDGFVDLADVLRAEEIQRTRVFFQILVALGLATGLAMPWLTGETWLRGLAAGLALGGVVINLGVLALLREPERYTASLSTALGFALATMGVGIIYYIGIFSAGAMILVVGIYFFGLSHHRPTARITYATVALLYLVTSTAIAAGLVPDRALFSTDAAQPFTRWFQVVMSQLIFALTFYLARSSRRVTEGAIERVRKANLQIQKRDALLMEAKGELDRAIRASDGRHTGTRVGDFDVGELLGRGAMGEVYRAHDGLGRAVAVKVLSPGLVGDSRKMQRFLREAEAAAAVQSPHVPRVFGSGFTSDGETPYLAMELLEGHDLGWHLRKTGRLSLELVVEMVEQVAKALADVREAGVVHRDLKPGNIFLVDALPRRWKVLDFGLSKILWEASSLTKDHAVGTPSYMAPEQVKGRKVDHLADLYALTAIAYRAATGVPPFSGNEIAHVLYRVLNVQPPSPADLVSLPVDMELVLAIGLAKKPEERFRDVETLAVAMRAAFEGRLDDATRARGWQLVKRRPWGEKLARGERDGEAA